MPYFEYFVIQLISERTFDILMINKHLFHFHFCPLASCSVPNVFQMLQIAKYKWLPQCNNWSSQVSESCSYEF
jgi:hypothetical protein